MPEMEINKKFALRSTDVSRKRRFVSDGITISEDDHLPEWLLTEVLCRLPIKAVFRFKRVSKQWLSLISDPCFARFYSSNWVSRPPWVFAFKRMYVKGCTLSHFSEDKLMDIMHPPPDSPFPNYFLLPLPNSQEPKNRDTIFTIEAVHNGFVLYNENSSVDQFYVCNPMTKQWFPLPRPKHVYEQFMNLGFTTQVEAGVLTSYRVVSVRSRPEKHHYLDFEVFCSETGEWVHHTVCSQREIQVAYNKQSVFLNGNDREFGLIAYDPYKNPDKFRLIDLPEDLDRDCGLLPYVRTFNGCGVHQGLLKYFEGTYGCVPHFKIWVLEDYNLGRWCLQHTVAFGDIDHGSPFFARCARLLCFHPYDTDIAYLRWPGVLVSYNMRTKRVKIIDFPHKPEMNHIISDCFPLVLPPWPICIPSSLIPKL